MGNYLGFYSTTRILRISAREVLAVALRAKGCGSVAELIAAVLQRWESGTLL